jgi:hypothetical protein
MIFSRRITESAAATKTFTALRIERRVLTTPSRTIPISNISMIGVGTHVPAKPTLLYWGLAALFLVMTFGSMRPDLSFGPLSPTGATVVLGFLTLLFGALALKPEDKAHYLLISTNDGVLSRFTAPDRAILDEVRSILTEKINRGDESMTFSINFEKEHIDNLAIGMGSLPPQQHALNGAGHASPPANSGAADRNGSQTGIPRTRPPASDAQYASQRPSRPQAALVPPQNGAAHADTFVDYSPVLSAVVEMHRFYARQPNTQHLEQRLSELELLMRAGTPTVTQKARLRELSTDMSQILQAYPQAVELFDHIGSLVAAGHR